MNKFYLVKSCRTEAITKQNSFYILHMYFSIFYVLLCPTYIIRVWLEAISYLSPDREKYWKRKVPATI